MRRKGSECTRISPAETSSGGKPTISLSSRSRRARPAPPDRERRPRQVRGVCGSRLLMNARRVAARFYRRARASVVTAFRSASNKRTSSPTTAAASPECTPARNSGRRQQQSAPPVVVGELHESEAVEECIRFMNSSSRKYR